MISKKAAASTRMKNGKPHVVWPVFLVFLGVSLGSATLFYFAFFFFREFIVELLYREASSLKLDLLMFAVAVSVPAYVLLHIGIRMFKHRVWISHAKK